MINNLLSCIQWLLEVGTDPNIKGLNPSGISGVIDWLGLNQCFCRWNAYEFFMLNIPCLLRWYENIGLSSPVVLGYMNNIDACLMKFHQHIDDIDSRVIYICFWELRGQAGVYHLTISVSYLWFLKLYNWLKTHWDYGGVKANINDFNEPDLLRACNLVLDGLTNDSGDEVAPTGFQSDLLASRELEPEFTKVVEARFGLLLKCYTNAEKSAVVRHLDDAVNVLGMIEEEYLDETPPYTIRQSFMPAKDEAMRRMNLRLRLYQTAEPDTEVESDYSASSDHDQGTDCDE